MSTTRIQPALGNTVRDVTTGFTGTATQLVEMMSGTVQLAVQPKMDAGKAFMEANDGAPPALSIDIHQLDVVDAGIADRVITPVASLITLGNEVEDIVTGFIGTAISRNTFLNGCVYYNVMPRQTKKQREEGTMPESTFLPVQRLKLLAPALAAQVAQTMTTPAAKRPGGPTTRAQRAN